MMPTADVDKQTQWNASVNHKSTACNESNADKPDEEQMLLHDTVYSDSFDEIKGTISPRTISRQRAIVDWIQRQKIPRKLSRKKHDTESTATNNDIYIVQGLESVVWGRVSAADSVVLLGVKPPRYLWYMLSGFCCDVIQFHIDLLLYFGLHLYDASLCWFLGFFASIVFRHTFHRYLVFGDYVGGYWNSLARMYAGYSIILVLSTAFNLFVTKSLAVPHYIGWIMTLLWTGIANYFILKKIWSFGGLSAKANSNDAAA